jgi:flagellar motility protein MotE (MotC chaperone)
MPLPVAVVVYVASTIAFWRTPTPAKHHATVQPSSASWDFKNPEADQLLAELKEEKKAVEKRQHQLDELAQRLDAERAEITQATDSVNKMQKDFDQSVLRVQQEETSNLKKLAKVYAAMKPDGAAAIFAGLDDIQVAKIMVYMEEDETAGILQVMAKKGAADAKRAAALSERLRLASFRNNTASAK